VQDLEAVHGHGGKTEILFDEPDCIVEIPKPHLALGFEGPDAEVDAMSNNCGPVLPGVRRAYYEIKSIKAPRGWKATACFWVGGEVCLRVESPEKFLYSEGKFTHCSRKLAVFSIGPTGIVDSHYPKGVQGEPEQVSVDGVYGKVLSDHYSRG